MPVHRRAGLRFAPALIRVVAQPLARRLCPHCRTTRETGADEVRPLLTLLADEAPVCAHCGGNVLSRFLVCPRCGATLRRRCRCGAALDDDWDWCPECGERTDE